MKKIKILFLLVIGVLLVSDKEVLAMEIDCNNYLRNGSKGENVLLLQEKLNETIDCSLEVDGHFGSLTKKCVKRYQALNGLEIDGVVGPITCKSLNKKTTKNNSNYDNQNNIQPGNKAIVIVNGYVNVRKSPTTESKIIGKANSGNIVRIVSKTGNWYKIVSSKKKYGYVRSDLVSKDGIIVDISSQKLNFYENGNLIFSVPVVTGVAGRHDTPIGAYTLYKANLQTDRVLRGTNDNGTKYAAPVDYWMPFITSRGIGFHDATWRSIEEFNKEQYLTDGSHGCVNMMHEDAERLFYSITKDTFVVVRK